MSLCWAVQCPREARGRERICDWHKRRVPKALGSALNNAFRAGDNAAWRAAFWAIVAQLAQDEGLEQPDCSDWTCDGTKIECELCGWLFGLHPKVPREAVAG